MSDTWTLTARWIFPVDQPPLENGSITIRGDRIAAVQAHGAVVADVDLGNVTVLPGLVNAHTHLDLSGMRGVAEPSTNFVGWLRQVIAFRRTRTSADVENDIRLGLAEAVSYGTTLLGDISGDGGSWDILVKAPLRAVVFREMLGTSADRAAGAWERSDRWIRSHEATANCRPAVSPHAPYSVRSSLFFAASTSGCPVAVHLAETMAEQELLVCRTGPFVRFLQNLDVWAPDGLAEDVGHVLRLLNGLSPTLLIHCNFLPPNDTLPANTSVVYCPSTHAAFGHPPHPFREFLKRGIRVALGTDSLASNPDLDILGEMRFVHARYPDVPGEVILRMGTLAGAQALGWSDETGSLTPGKSADLVVLPLPAEVQLSSPPLGGREDEPLSSRTRGERGWREGGESASRVAPLTPDPSPPEYGGRGEKSPPNSEATPIPADPAVPVDPYWLVLRSTLQVQKVLFRGQWVWSAAASPGSTA